MGKPWDKRSGRRKTVRKLQRHLVVCEDKKSAADYLRAFEAPEEFAEVVVEGGCGNIFSVVEKALDLRQQAMKNLKDKVETAKKNARKLLDDYGAKLNPERDNPSTNVHELVTVLQALGELGN